MGVRQVDEFESVANSLWTTQADFRIGKLDGSFSDSDDSEAVVEEYFKTLDYNTFNLSGLHHSKRDFLSHWFDFFEGFDYAEPGVPDLFVCRLFFQITPRVDAPLQEEAKVQDFRFVEVKSDSDDLRQSQLRWIGSNPHLPVEVIIVTEGRND